MNNKELIKALKVIKYKCKEMDLECYKCPMGFTDANGNAGCSITDLEPCNWEIVDESRALK